MKRLNDLQDAKRQLEGLISANCRPDGTPMGGKPEDEESSGINPDLLDSMKATFGVEVGNAISEIDWAFTALKSAMEQDSAKRPSFSQIVGALRSLRRSVIAELPVLEKRDQRLRCCRSVAESFTKIHHEFGYAGEVFIGVDEDSAMEAIELRYREFLGVLSFVEHWEHRIAEEKRNLQDECLRLVHGITQMSRRLRIAPPSDDGLDKLTLVEIRKRKHQFGKRQDELAKQCRKLDKAKPRHRTRRGDEEEAA